MRYFRLRRFGLPAAALAIAGAVFGATAHGQGLPGVTPPPTTLWKFLGIPQTVQRLRDGTANRFGNRPGLERRPPVKPLAHPDNLESQNPAIKRAAEIKAQEDLAPQKIKAVKYLAKIGCGCYDKDGSVTAALVAALDDCTPRVREATIEAITEATREGACTACNQQCCCNEDLVKKLYEIAYEKDDEGCWVEPSEEIREAAREAMMACCQGRGPEGPIYEEPLTPPRPAPGPVLPPEGPARPRLPEEGTPSFELPEEGTGFLGNPPAGVYFEEAGDEGFSTEGPLTSVEELENGWEIYGPVGFSTDQGAQVVHFTEYSGRKAVSAAMAPQRSAQSSTAPAAEGFSGPEGFSDDGPSQTVSPHKAMAMTARGLVAAIDARDGVVHVNFEPGREAPVGAKLVVYHEYFTGRTRLGHLQVIQSRKGAVAARPLESAMFNKIRRGDDVVYAPGG